MPSRGRGGPRTPALRSPMEGLREDTRARTQAGPALRPRVEKLLVVPAGRWSRSPALSVRDQLQPSSKARQCRLCTHALVTAITPKRKKNLLTFLFLTPAEILLRVPLAQFYSSKLWPCLCFRRHAFPQLLIDLEVGTFRFGGMINHQQPGHGLGSAAGGGSYVLSQSVVAEIPILLREFGNVVCFHALSFPSRYSLKENKSNLCAFFERLEAAFF